MERVLREQCNVAEEKVELNKKTGGEVMQNPSDGDATYDGETGSPILEIARREGIHVPLAPEI